MKTQSLSKLFLSVFFLIGSGEVSASLSRPLCVAIGTEYEGWIIPGEDPAIKSSACADKVMECATIGTRSEGWYVYQKLNEELLQRAPCRWEFAQPTCMFIGTPDEGWVVPARGMRIYYEHCEGKGVECTGETFGTEGWYIFDKKLLGLYKYSECSAFSSN
jgi:hypothetical protein